MEEYNIYSGRRELKYQFTEPFESEEDANSCALELIEADSEEYGYPLEEWKHKVVKTSEDNIPIEKRVGQNYF